VELARHLRGMFYRINYGFEKKDVRLLETKGNNSAFEYAVIAARYLELEYGYQVQESEIVYLSYRFFTHFGLNANHGKQNILVVMDKGANTSDLFIYELTLEFGNYIGDFDSAEIYQIPYLPIENFDCLITDIPSLKFDNKIPVLRVNYFLTEKDITLLKDYFTRRSENAVRFLNSFREELFVRNIEAESKEEVIKLLYDKVIDNMELDTGVYENILERERMASTEQGNCTATPHSFYAVKEEPLIVAGVLKKPIIWDKEKCRLVFLVLNGSMENELFTALSMIKIAVQDIRFVYNMINARTFDQVKLCISDYMDRIK
jgi:lichenan operon transcriptional antiterminator